MWSFSYACLRTCGHTVRTVRTGGSQRTHSTDNTDVRTPYACERTRYFPVEPYLRYSTFNLSHFIIILQELFTTGVCKLLNKPLTEIFSSEEAKGIKPNKVSNVYLTVLKVSVLFRVFKFCAYFCFSRLGFFERSHYTLSPRLISTTVDTVFLKERQKCWTCLSYTKK